MKDKTRPAQRRHQLAPAGHAERTQQLLPDMLGERLAYERTAVRLYDALIGKFETLQDDSSSMTLADLYQIREDEARHATILAEAIVSLGGDPDARTPGALLAETEASGLVRVVNDPQATMSQALHAMTMAELSDEAGWELLIALAEDARQGTMVADFSLALTEEETHLQRMQQWYEESLLGVAISDGLLIDDMADDSPSHHLH
jgi:bacterioferritin (cytochrome b1)